MILTLSDEQRPRKRNREKEKGRGWNNVMARRLTRPTPTLLATHAISEEVAPTSADTFRFRAPVKISRRFVFPRFLGQRGH